MILSAAIPYMCSFGGVFYVVAWTLTMVIRDAEKRRVGKSAPLDSQTHTVVPNTKLSSHLMDAPRSAALSPDGSVAPQMTVNSAGCANSDMAQTTTNSVGDSTYVATASFDPGSEQAESPKPVKDRNENFRGQPSQAESPTGDGNAGAKASPYASAKSRLRRLMVSSIAIIGAVMVVIVTSLKPGTIASVRRPDGRRQSEACGLRVV